MGVLDDMTKGITERKAQAAGPSLTPVGAEASPVKPSGIPDVPEVFLTNEALIDHAKGLRKFAADAIAIAEGLDKMTERDTAVPVEVDQKAEKKAREKAADEKVAKTKAGTPLTPEAKKLVDHMESLKADAQAAVFPDLDAGIEEEPASSTPVETDGWVCPVHGTKSIVDLKSKKGRDYRACTVKGCKQFER